MAAKEITKDAVVNEAVRILPESVAIFNKFNIDSCCGGAVSIEAAAKRDGADLAKLLEELNGLVQRTSI